MTLIRTVCPCALAVRLDYAELDEIQSAIVRKFIEILGEYLIVTIGDKHYKVSRHCIALHGIKAEEIEKYGLEEIK